MTHDIEELNRCLAANKANAKSAARLHLVMGNQGADLDSIVSSVVYAFLLSELASAQRQSEPVAILPLVNVPRADFPLRREVEFLFQDVGIDVANLAFVDELDLRSVMQDRELALTLVDHNRLPDDQAFLEPAVVEIIDHHAVSGQFSRPVSIEIEPVGSTATLVTHRIPADKPELLGPGLAKLLLGTILLDTANLDQGAQRTAKKDRDAVARLDALVTVDHEELFSGLQEKKSDIEGMTIDELLRKDLKLYDFDGLRCSISSIPLALSHWRGKENELAGALRDFADSRKLDAVVVMLFVSDPDFRREAIVFARNEETGDRITAAFESASAGLEPLPGHAHAPDGAISFFGIKDSRFSRKRAESALIDHSGTLRGDGTARPERIDELFRLLIAENEAEFRRSEDLGEGRLNIFLTVVGVSLAALATALSNLAVDRLLLGISVLGFAALMLVGWSTFLRILKRNVASDTAIEANARMMRFLMERYNVDARVERALPFDPYGLGDPPIKKRSKKPLNPFTDGGLAQTVILLNGFIAFVLGILLSVLVYLHVSYYPTVKTALPWIQPHHVVGVVSIGLVAAVLCGGVHIYRGKRYYRQEQEERRGKILARTKR